MNRFGLIAPGEYYHVYNRGVGKKILFHSKPDYTRFLFLILYFQSPITFPQVGRYVDEFVKHPMLDNMQEIINKRSVEVVSFCIMPNHFHLTLKEEKEGGIALYMQRILNAYAKYYNTKYENSGHVFQGAYKLVHIDNEGQLRHLSAYIHKNPREISEWRDKYEEYPWSSYQDFIEDNRFGKLLVPDIMMGEFGKNDYKEFVRTSLAKLIEGEIVV